MKLELVNSSVVVLAEAHNPTILHPHFLAGEEIVPKEWELSEPPLCTPAVSVVKYKNGLVFTVEEKRFQILEPATAGQVRDMLCPALATRYVEKLPHVRYQAVGVNFFGFVECAENADFLKARFLRPESISGGPLAPVAVGLNFVFDLQTIRFRLQCDVGDVSSSPAGPKRGGILLSGNFHTDLDQSARLDGARRAISLFWQRHGEFQQTAQKILGLEG